MQPKTLEKQLTRVFVDSRYADTPQAQEICRRLAHVPQTVVDDSSEINRLINSAEDPVSAAKTILYLTGNKGRFVRKCPGTRYYTCCGYQILHIGTFCTMDCSYCILQSYFHPPMLQFFVNHDQMFEELDGELKNRSANIRRMGTGEFTDSLIWQPITDLSFQLTKRFAAQDHAVLELKTKTVNIQGFGDIDHNRKTIMSWSVNTPRVIAEQERNTAPLQARLEAARKCESWGYPVSFHFDPMVAYPGCEEEYARTVAQIFRAVRPENVVWISIGSFRCMPDLKPVIGRRFTDSDIIYGEMIRGTDEKLRYFKPVRIQLYKSIVRAIRDAAPDVCAYFCMEDEIVWQECMGFCPEPETGLPRMLDQSAHRVCGITPAL